ncbi:hypothetical protein FOMPIDRAFT_1044853 [Fomitopsis schrenkii]|uniref:Uncharacterized protein n=1 Tax=Fomitopsis schrenkii TaxID=2126942 RepID=S8FWM7_FOMSC|nr:hypothetical protein FOMPIDRAFT_1044853 [Fomitopsis schrenkii]
MRRLPNVDVLHFHEFDSEGFMELITPVGPNLTISSAIAAVFNFPRLKALFLRFLYLQFGAELLGFPAAFPHLEVLQVCSISWKQLPVNLVTGHARHDGPGRRLRGYTLGTISTALIIWRLFSTARLPLSPSSEDCVGAVIILLPCSLVCLSEQLGLYENSSLIYRPCKTRPRITAGQSFTH